MIRAYLVDDEPLALKRLTRMLEAYPDRVRICGSNTDPVDALEELRSVEPAPDVLFLDIHMPGLSGFELLAELPEQPMVIFTTAYYRYALEAFQVNSIDYLLKPIEPEHLDRALTKAERMSGPKTDLRALLRQIGDKLGKSASMERIASRSGDKVELVITSSPAASSLLRRRSATMWWIKRSPNSNTNWIRRASFASIGA